MNRDRGYTLLELMLVVLLIGISMALAMPSISTAMAEQTQSNASLSVLDVFRTARSRAIQSGAPTLVLATAAPSGEFWILQAPQTPGVVVGCSSVNWVALAGLQQIPLNTVLNFDDLAADEEWNAFGINVIFNGGAGTPGVCYTPLGRVYYSANGAAGPFSDAQGAAPGGALTIGVRRTQNAITRDVVVPLGSGMPRLGN
ncbi:MAG: prepilin-type N-terminal cleavage/methylation domain-containing protein [Deltaproteobacteria bacterium]|nr:prepilin-type N-terminal cleavage/methylation domain-containing protein [Deltaproteobacteria bacterium]